MTHCVPDWDGHGGELDAIIATTDYFPPVKEKWVSSLVPKGSHASDLASLQTSDVPSGWTENGPVGPKPEGHGAKIPDWQVNCNTWTAVREGTVDAITPSKPRTSQPPPPVSNGVLAVNVPVLDPTMSNSMMADDEMVSWLQYPLDDTLEKSYCSDFFGELPNSTDNTMQAIKDSLAVGQHTAAAGRPNCRNLPTVPGRMNGSLNRVVSADAAMAMGAGRAAGVLPQAGVEVFTKVRTQQPYSGKWSPNTSTATNPAKTVAASAVHNTSTSTTQQHQLQQQPLRAPMVGVTTSGIPNITSSMLLQPSKPQLGPLQFAVQKKGTMNFSHFSVPAVNMKASLQCLGMSYGGTPAQNRLKSPYHLPNMPNSSRTRPFDATTSSGSSIAESTTTRLQSEDVSRNDTDVRGVEGSPDGGQQPSLATESSWPSSLPNSLSTKEAEVAANSTAGTHVEFESRPADQQEAKPAEPETRQNSNDRSNAAATPSTDAAVTPPQQIPEAPEATLTSSSGGSGNTSKGVAGNRGKRRSRDQEESEIQSDDAEDEVVELKKPQQRTNPSKRTRAAEVHNLSERRRRDRINEKMKALQELIPNSNKADKASMLDEAIEYLKMLQIQLQMMSMRSGMSIPSLIPNGMQQVSQMGGMAPMGMGLGMMGIGPMVGIAGMGPMGHMLDMNSMAAAGRTSHLIPHLSHGHGGVASHTGSPMMPHHQMPAHGGASYNVSQTMDVYNAYMIHQQQQHQYQHQQQQQQQHQLHHLPSNMAGGGLQ